MGIVSFVREPAIALLGISIALACNGAAPTAGYEAAKTTRPATCPAATATS